MLLNTTAFAQESKLTEQDKRLIYSRAYEAILWASPALAIIAADGGYMTDAFDRGATGCGELSKILAAVTDELWKRGYSDEDLAKIYGGNKLRA